MIESCARSSTERCCRPVTTAPTRRGQSGTVGIDHHPAVVAQCRSAVDVAAALAYAQQAGLEVGVRGGGHGYGGAAVPEGGLTIDLSELRRVTIDPVSRRARCGGGATQADIDAAAQEHGLAVTGGTISHTGIGGLTLGGGIGWLTRACGLAVDNLVSAEVVLADGRCVRACAESRPGAAVGAHRRWRELRRRHRVRVPAAPRSARSRSSGDPSSGSSVAAQPRCGRPATSSTASRATPER